MLWKKNKSKIPPVPKLDVEHLWSLDVSLAAILADAIPRLRDLDHGHPYGLTLDEWRTTLTEMADGFAQYAESDKTGFDPDVDKLNRSLDLLKQWYMHLWD